MDPDANRGNQPLTDVVEVHRIQRTLCTRKFIEILRFFYVTKQRRVRRNPSLRLHNPTTGRVQGHANPSLRLHRLTVGSITTGMKLRNTKAPTDKHGTGCLQKTSASQETQTTP